MCTRIFWNTNGVAKVVARTIDWEVSDQPGLWALPRGLARHGAAGESSATWTSGYGSVSTTSWDGAHGDGLNEAGLAAHVLYLGEADYEPAENDDRPTLSNLMWVQYALDNFTTVAEALAGLSDVRVVPFEVGGFEMPIHLALEDATGDAAIVEMIGGTPVIHHGPEFNVMANDPNYDAQLANLRRYDGFGGSDHLPGDIVSTDRFVRASYFLKYLPEPADRLEAVAGVLGLARNVAIPYGAPDNRFPSYPTWWISVSDLTNGVYFFQSTRSPNTIWLELDALDLDEGQPPRWVDPRRVELVGDVRAELTPRALPLGVTTATAPDGRSDRRPVAPAATGTAS